MKAVLVLCLFAIATASGPEERYSTCFNGYTCPGYQPCCPNRYGGYTCCAFDQGTCCGDLMNCCPYTYKCGCDGNCYPGDSNITCDIRLPKYPLTRMPEL
ncbi:granulin-like [Artemia franciscana]|uniref:granulin-like n=1 Tax=Artemia franciscana TaxID=6661 RepID=UPI0032DAAB1C